MDRSCERFKKINCLTNQVKNDIASAIFRRVLKVKTSVYLGQKKEFRKKYPKRSSLTLLLTQAHKAGETFRVFILMPLLPAFEGDVSGDSGTGATIKESKYNILHCWNNKECNSTNK